MFEDILTKTFYGNQIEVWLFAFILIFCAILTGKILYWISSNVLKKLTKKTKTKIDDIIIDMIEEPILLALTLAGIWFALRFLSFSTAVDSVIGSIFQALIIANIAWLLTRLFDAFFKEYIIPLSEKTETDLDDQLLPVLRKGVKIIVWTIAIIIALNNAGYNVGALLAGLGIGGLAFAMAAKDTLSNIFGGFTIFADKPFKIGDRIIISGIDGTVKEIGLRSTRLVTLEGRVVTIPNSKFSENPVENISLEPSRKVKIILGLTYDTTEKQMEKAMKILKEIASKNKNLEKKITVAFSEFADSSMNISLTYFIKKSSNIVETQTEVNMGILKQFNKNKLDLAFPSQTVYHK